MTVALIALGASWFASGVWSYVYWWTKKYDFTTNGLELIAAFACGVAGPTSFFLCWAVLGGGEEKIVFKKRK